MAAPLHVTCLGLACPVGLTPESAAAAMRCSLDGFAELPYIDDTGEPIIGAVVPGLPAELRGRARLAELLALAFNGVAERLPPGLALDQLPLLLCTREPDRPGAKVNGIVGEVEGRLGLTFSRHGSGHLARGPVGVFEALAHARRLLAEGRTEACLIAAVDTLIDARSLLWLDRAKRLKTLAQSDGVIPGEGAGVLLVSTRPLGQAHLVIAGLGFASETATILDDEPALGTGMANAVRSALAEAGLQMHEIGFRLSDMTGESYAFEEVSLVVSRVLRQRRECIPIWHAGDKIGDSGATAGLVQLAVAEHAFVRSYAPGLTALCHGSSAFGARAAALIGRQPGHSGAIIPSLDN